MAVFLFSLLAILLFWAFADKQMFRSFIPITITSIFARFLEHFILIDWLGIMQFQSDGGKEFWLPIFADLTFWPVIGYLFIQYMPNRHRLLYALGWCAGLVSYLHLLKLVQAIKFTPHWFIYMSPLTVGLFFGTVYAIWRWLYPTTTQVKERRTVQ